MNEIIKIDDLSPPDGYMKYTIMSNKIIANIEKVVRNSYHYKILIFYLKHFLDLNRCAYYEGYNMSNGVGVQIHHSPITLYEYTYAVANKYLLTDGYYKIMNVARDVSKLHYEFKVGLVPLNPTAHKLVHKQKLEIHPDLVKGDWMSFYEEYKEFASDSLRKTVEDANFMKEHDDPNRFPIILRRSENIFEQKNIQLIKDINVSKMLTDMKLSKMGLDI